MTLWTWVDNAAQELRAHGNTALAEAVERMPQLAAAGDVSQINAELPVALRSARSLAGHEWVESYLEHWPLAARVGDRGEGTSVLEETQSRVRAAHAPERNEGCPPAVCAAENVLVCQSNIDGPGYAADRAALLAEAMAHTRPGEPAWESLVLAHCDMLVDDERPDEAVRNLDVRAEEARAAGTDVSPAYGFGYLRALRHQDRYTEALQILDHLAALSTWPRGAANADAHRRLRLERSRLVAWLARTGQCSPQEAREALPDVGEAEQHPRLRPGWAEAAEHLVAVGALDNDWQLGVRITTWSRYCERVGAYRPCLELSLAAARLAAARGARWTAQGALQRARRALAAVRRSDDMAADLSEAREEVDRIPPVELPVPAGDALDHLRQQASQHRDPERQADVVVAALAQRPDDSSLLNALGQVGRTLMLTDAAAEPHWRHVHQAPGDQKAALSLLETLLRDNDMAGVRTLVRTLTEAAASPEPTR
ncbi:hypothetical protein FHX37_2281 [Haloactinospora alba]|uniref:Tetratricopeptide repeat protein n=1 Tax=Haloactinospora alba TaxID=405555 RepID=A0A543NKK7_9ACTN|nr:hypothetical protein [Haloactinospora alba]TQN32330.1 hypothetical protein FHX37_2281 [Haloactinospora alba]